MKYVISASPLVKIYLPEWAERLTEDPDLIFDKETPFQFSINTGTSGFVLDFNKPMLVHRKRPGSSYQADDGRSAKIIQLPNSSIVSEGKEIEAIYGWLIGDSGQSYLETDIYGCVPFDPGIDMVERIDHMAALEALLSGDMATATRAKRDLDQVQADTAKRMADARARVVKDSEARIRRAMKTVHNNLIRQWQINAESNMGKYPPSISEALGAHALSAEIAAKKEKGKALYGKIDGMMAGNTVG